MALTEPLGVTMRRSRISSHHKPEKCYESKYMPKEPEAAGYDTLAGIFLISDVKGRCDVIGFR